MNTAHVNDSKLRSPLQEAMLLRPKRRAGKRKIVVALVLTSLVDAFSIMLLYLLCQNTGNGSTIEMQKSAQLPTAIRTNALHEGTLVRIEGNQYFVGNEPVADEQLPAKLQQMRVLEKDQGQGSDMALILQADKGTDFDKLQTVIRAGSISGYHQFKFAVLQGEGE